MDYPKMIYAGGDLAGEYRIVQDEAEESEAQRDGFWAHDRPSKKPAQDAAATQTQASAAAPASNEAAKPGPKPKAP